MHSCISLFFILYLFENGSFLFKTLAETREAVCFLMADLRGRHISYGPISSQFHAVFRKFWQNLMLGPPPPPPRALATPPTGNPGSAPVSSHTIFGTRPSVRNEKENTCLSIENPKASRVHLGHEGWEGNQPYNLSNLPKLVRGAGIPR